MLASLSSRKDAIFNLAFDRFNETLYGEHPYGRPLEGSIDSVKGFNRSDFQTWHRDKISPDQAILSIIAPLAPGVMHAKLQRTIGKWKVSPPASQPLTHPFQVRLLKQSISREIRSSFEQAYLMVGWQAPGAIHSDQIPLKVLNALLGGGMSSTLFVTLREKLPGWLMKSPPLSDEDGDQ